MNYSVFDVFTEKLSEAINARSLGPVLPHLPEDIRLDSASAGEPLIGRHRVTNHLQRVLEDLAARDPINFVAVPGHMTGDDGAERPCAVVFDGFRKAMLLCPEGGTDGGLRVLRIVTDRRRLQDATVLDPPQFPEETHLPSHP